MINIPKICVALLPLLGDIEGKKTDGLLASHKLRNSKKQFTIIDKFSGKPLTKMEFDDLTQMYVRDLKRAIKKISKTMIIDQTLLKINNDSILDDRMLIRKIFQEGEEHILQLAKTRKTYWDESIGGFRTTILSNECKDILYKSRGRILEKLMENILSTKHDPPTWGLNHRIDVVEEIDRLFNYNHFQKFSDSLNWYKGEEDLPLNNAEKIIKDYNDVKEHVSRLYHYVSEDVEHFKRIKKYIVKERLRPDNYYSDQVSQDKWEECEGQLQELDETEFE